MMASLCQTGLWYLKSRNLKNPWPVVTWQDNDTLGVANTDQHRMDSDRWNTVTCCFQKHDAEIWHEAQSHAMMLMGVRATDHHHRFVAA